MSKRSATKSKMKKAVKRVRAHNAIPRSLGAGTPPGAVKYLTTALDTGAGSTDGYVIGCFDCPTEGTVDSGILNIAQIPRGDGAQLRKYNKATLKSVAIRGSITVGQSTTQLFVSGVVMLVYDRNRNQRSTLAISEILGQAYGGYPSGTGAQLGYHENSLTEPNGAPRFKILRRWPFVIQPVAGTNGLPSTVMIDAFVNLKNKPISWINSDTVGASANCMDGPLYLVLVSSGQAVVDVARAAQFLGSTRLYFADP